MEISKIRQIDNKIVSNKNQNTTSQKNTSFKGGWGDLVIGCDSFLKFLDTNPAWGASFVDLGCMVAPRTITDFGRGVNAGLETGRREGSGTLNHASIGLYGLAVGLLLAMGINKSFDLKNAGSIFADAETLDLHAKNYDKTLKTGLTNQADVVKNYLKQVLSSYEALSPKEDAKWVRFDEEHINNAAEILKNAILSDNTKLPKDKFLKIRNLLMQGTKVENTYRIIADNSEVQHTSRYSLDFIINNCFKLGSTFNKPKVKKAFLESENYLENVFLKALKSMNVKRSLLGIGIGAAVGMSVQPINIYLTKKKTGSSAFVGGGEEDKSLKFKIKKAITSTAFGAMVLSTIGNPKNLIKDLQFKGATPTIKQFKFIYGATIISRFMAARNDNELKESSIKDTLGFINWLILGNFVQKLIAESCDKSLVKTDGKGLINWIKNSALKTRDEVLFESLGKQVFDKDNKALDFKQLAKLADKATQKKLRILTVAQILGYLYSGVVLGFGIPKLNIYLTNKRMKQQQAKENAQNNNSNMFILKNDKFLNK